MKIVQSKSFGNEGFSCGHIAYYDQDCHFYFDPTLYSGITGIYLETQGKVMSGGQTLSIKLRDETHSTDITTVEFTTQTRTRKRSADLKDVLVSACTLNIYVKTNDGLDSAAAGVRLVIEQDDSGVGRKTATYFPLNTSGTGTGATWQVFGGYGERDGVRAKIDDFDGTKKAYFDTYLKTQSGATANARLYDLTAFAPVAGSEVSTSDTSFAHVMSGEITLIQDHDYWVQIKSDTAGKNVYIQNAAILITAAGFTKIVSVPVSFDLNWNEEPDGYESDGARNLFEPAKTDGEDGLSFECQQNCATDGAGALNVNIRLYDLTAASAISGTAHLINDDGEGWHCYEDTPTMPVGDAELEAQFDQASCLILGPIAILAFQQENFPAAWATLPSPLQFTGYHCFMSQYIKNCLSGYVPFFTPDCVNRCW